MVAKRAMGWLGMLLLMAWQFPAAAGSAPVPPGKLLEMAAGSRSSDLGRFATLLGELEERQSELSPSQKEELRYLRAYRLAFEGRYEPAVLALKPLATTAGDTDVKARAGALLVNIHARTRQFVDGLRQLDATLRILGEVKNPDVRVHAFKEAAYIYNQVGQYDLALRYADRMLETVSDSRGACFGNEIRLESLARLKRLPQDAVVLGAIRECEALGEHVVANAIRLTLAREWAGGVNRTRAIDLLQAHLREVEATGYTHLVALFKSQLAGMLTDLGNLDTAESYATEVLGHAGESGSAYAISSAYHALYRIAESRDDVDKALVYYRRYVETEKAHLDDVKARELAYQIVHQETLEKSREIQRLDSANQMLKLQRRVERQARQNTRLVIVLLTGLLAVIGYWIYKTRRVQQSLRQLAETDALTGLCNRHHFSQRAHRLLQHCERNGEEATLIMFDLDHFKAINDRYGHPAGDWVLKQVARTAAGLCRRIDVLGRLGGEEFALLLYGCDLRSAVRLAEDVRVGLATLDTRDSGYRFQISASFGVTSASRASYVLERMLSCADMMLYRSKREGRNRVSAVPEDVDPPMAGENAPAGLDRDNPLTPRGGEADPVTVGPGAGDDVRAASLSETGIR